jgi:nitrate/nitrite transport system substrate-binding protein
MNLNHNGQAITCPRSCRQGRVDGPSLAKLMQTDKREYTFAPDLPHRHPRHVAVLLAGDLRHQPDEGRKVITVPPPQMVANMRVATWTATAWASPGATAPSWTASA